MRAGVPHTIEHEYTPLSGQRLTLQTFKGPYRDDAGNVVGVLGIARDVTRRKRAEDDLKEAKEQAEAANRAKDRFMAVLSHELRSPLTPVLALASAWERTTSVPAELREDLAVIRRNVELEVRLIDDLLDMTRIAKGKLRLSAEPVDAHELLRHAARTCPADELAGKRLGLSTDLCATRPFVHADAARFHQVLWNLLNNAIKFTPDGGRITVRTWDAEGGALAVEVSDTGIGIGPDLLPRIFDAFEQGADEVTHRFGGLGLGLAICKALMTAMGGQITAASDGPGRGASFRLLLPTCEAPATTRHPAGNDNGVAGRDQPLLRNRPLRILLVEDNVDTSRAMSRLLSRIGHHVRTAGTVRAAVDAAREGPVDVVISDLGLPDGSGHDLMRLLRGLGPVRGIALSGYGTDDDVRKSHDAGFETHLTKPTDFQHLLDTIDRLAP
jgi:two-component system CheB/CheR fusion protein